MSIGSASSDSAHPITSQSSISSGDSNDSHPDRKVIKVSLLLPGQEETVNYKSMIVSRINSVFNRVDYTVCKKETTPVMLFTIISYQPCL